MWSQMSEPDQRLKAAACDTRPTAGTYNCTVFSFPLCPFQMTWLLPEGLELCCRGFQTRSAVLGSRPLLAALWSCRQRLHPHLHRPLGMGSLAATGSQVDRSIPTLQRDLAQPSLPLEHLQAVPGRMRHLSQEVIKLLEPSKGNFNCKCLPCSVHVQPVPLMSLTQTELVVALNKHFDFSWRS